MTLERTLPTRWSTAIFNVKAAVLRARRWAFDLRDGVQRFEPVSSADYPVLLAESRTPLWSSVVAHELGLQRGKVQNLRAAVRHIDGVGIPAGALWSFWKHVGRATASRGFAPGRMLREGCVIPTIGGGICQLSNGLYEVALKSRCDIVERHRHSQILPGSAAAAGRDATVVWNYIDLRFRPAQDIRLTAQLTDRELVLRVHGKVAASERTVLESATPALTAGDCATCGEVRCFRNNPTPPRTDETSTAFLVDEAWPEHVAYVTAQHGERDMLCLPLDGQRWGRPRYAWPTEGFAAVHDAPVETLRRALTARRLGRYGARRLQAELDASRRLAHSYGRHLHPDITHLVVAQSLLPFLWLEGVLGGRTFDVLMTRQPLADLHAALDGAQGAQAARSLGEFRAAAELVSAESAALARARHIVTPHRQLAARFGARARVTEWSMPQTTPRAPVHAVGFCGPTAARKGAYTLREALRGLDVEIVVSGGNIEDTRFWEGFRVRFGTAREVAECAVVVQPALLEDAPRGLLAALAAGRRVVATAACGLADDPRLVTVPVGDVGALSAALRDALVWQGACPRPASERLRAQAL